MCGVKIRRETMMLWILAIGFYVVGDTSTTLLSIRAGSVEANPLVAHLFETGGLSLFLLLKAGLVAVALLASVIDHVPRRDDVPDDPGDRRWNPDSLEPRGFPDSLSQRGQLTCGYQATLSLDLTPLTAATEIALSWVQRGEVVRPGEIPPPYDNWTMTQPAPPSMTALLLGASMTSPTSWSKMSSRPWLMAISSPQSAALIGSNS